MLLTTQGLVLHTIKYGETSVIAKVFTRDLGLCSYIIKGVRTPKGRTKQNLLQPLSHLEMTVYNNPKKDLQFVKEMRPETHDNNYSVDGVRMALRFFMDEVLYKSLKENEPNQSLFDYVVDELHKVDASEQDAYQPIKFLIHTASHLGIEPMDNYSAHEPFFNLKEGRFLSSPTPFMEQSLQNGDIDYYLDADSSRHIHACLSSRETTPLMTARQRSTTLGNLLEYYHIHLSDFNNFKSHEVLHSVLR